jgi:hypothetical protein
MEKQDKASRETASESGRVVCVCVYEYKEEQAELGSAALSCATSSEHD